MRHQRARHESERPPDPRLVGVNWPSAATFFGGDTTATGESSMKRIVNALLLAVIFSGPLVLTGCIVEPARPYAAAVWVPGHYRATAYGSEWIPGHWR
jgi:hypothetical protein